MGDLLTPQQFAAKIKAKYPEYADVDDVTLSRKIVEKYPEYADRVQLDPSLKRVGAGLLAETAVGEGSKVAGALAGAKAGAALGAVGGPVGSAAGAAIGATVGYVSGALAGGVGGSLLAQEIEGRDEVSWGRVTADTAINLIPGGLGKAKKGLGILPRLAQEGAKRAAGGAVISAGGAQLEKAVEDRELLTQDELGKAVFVGGALGLGLGAAGELMKKAYPKFGGKGGDVLNEAYEKGDPDATQIVETLAGENPVGRGGRLKRMVFEKVAPSKLVGKDATMDAIRAKNEAEAAVDLAASVRRIIDDASEGASKKELSGLDDYIFNKSQDLPSRFEGIKDTLDGARKKIDQYQNTVYEMYKSGELDIDPRIAAKIKDSIDSKNYFTREYRFYEDSNYRPSADAENNLRISMKKSGADDDEINKFLQDLQDSRSDSVRLMNTIAGNKRVFKRKDLSLSDEMLEYLGEYKEAGERMFGTISRLGKLASYEAGNRRIANEMLRNNIGKTFTPGEVPEGFEPLVIRGRVMREGDMRVPRKLKTPDGYVQSSKLQEGNTIYVPEDANRALNELYGSGSLRDSGPWFSRLVDGLLSSTTAAAKFVRVPLNLASYPVQLVGNAVLTAGQGFNPFRAYGKGMRVAINETLPNSYKSGRIPILELNRLKELGIVNKGVTASDIRDGFKNGVTPKFFQKAVKGVGNAYNTFDTAQRISVYENYKGFLKDIIPGANIKSMGKSEFEQMAADLTNDTYMNYDRINKGVRSLSRYGILNEFGAFNFELMRTTYNQARLARSMVSGDFSNMLKDKYGVSINPDTQKRIQREGYKRFAALSAVLTAGSTVPMVMNREGGIDEEKERALRETALAPWEQDQALHIRKDGNKVRVANLGYQIPTAELSTIVESGFKGENFMDSAGRVIDSMWGKFGGDLTINMKNIVSAVNNMDQSGRQISSRPEGMAKNLDLIGWYLGETFTPGTVSDLQKLDERESMDNVLRYTLGYRVRNLDVLDGARYKFNDINKNIRGLRSKYAGATFGEGDISGDYDKQNSIYRENIAEAIRHTNNLRTLEVSEEEIQKLLKKSFSKNQTQEIMTGVISDMPISSNVSISDRQEKRTRYVDLAKKMPEAMAIRMLQEDYDRGKLKRGDIRAILMRLKGESVISK